MNGKLLGTAVGVALENQEAIRNASAPTMNALGGVAQVIFRTFWKSTVVGFTLMVTWVAAFGFTSFLAGPTFLGDPMFLFSFGLFLFLVLPFIICVRETRRVSKSVAAKNKGQRVAAQQAREAREAEYAQAMAQWQAQQELEQAQAQQQWQAQQFSSGHPQFQRSDA